MGLPEVGGCEISLGFQLEVGLREETPLGKGG